MPESAGIIRGAHSLPVRYLYIHKARSPGTAMTRTLRVAPEGEIARFLRSADREPVLLETEDAVFQVIKVSNKQTVNLNKQRTEDIRAALRESAGALSGIDVDALKSEIRDQRQQDSRGRPA